MAPLEIQNIHVRKGMLDLEVRCSLENLHVTEKQAQQVLALYPNLERHVCVNDCKDGAFGAEIIGTELPHLLEHLIIELQAQIGSYKSRLIGHTSWLDELNITGPKGYALMRVTVGFMNDFVALRALHDALEIINSTVGTVPVVDREDRPCGRL